jgi:hypothetical protein
LIGQIEQLDYRACRGFNQIRIRQLLEGHRLRHQQNLLLTGMAKVIWPVRWDVILSAQADGSYPKLISQLTQVAILILDDRGTEILDASERSNLLEIIDTRHGKVSTLVAS